MPALARLLPLALLIAACSQLRARDVVAPEGPIRRLVIEVERGDLLLRAGEAPRVARSAGGALQALEARVEGEALHLEARCLPLLPCTADLEVEVPAGTPVELRLGEGGVRASGLGALYAAVREGRIEAEADGPIDLRLGRGHVDVELSGPVPARIAVGAGDIDVLAPPGLPVEARAATVNLPPDAARGPGLLMVAPAGTATLRWSASLARR